MAKTKRPQYSPAKMRSLTRVRKIIAQHYEVEDRASSVVDILTDVRHYCAHYNLPFENAYSMSLEHVAAETRNEVTA